MHPLRAKFLNSVKIIKAPLMTTSATLKRESEIKPPVWFNRDTDTIPDIRVRTAIQSRRTKRDKILRERREKKELANSGRAKSQAMARRCPTICVSDKNFAAEYCGTKRPISEQLKRWPSYE
jgi:hypothetical protein